MNITFSHLRVGTANAAIFDADSRSRSSKDRDVLLADLTARVRPSGLQVDRAALAFREGSRTVYYGDRDLVRYLGRNVISIPEPPSFGLRSLEMAKNPPNNNARKGSVTNRTQFKHPNGNWVKRDRTTGQFLDQKTTPGPYKGVAKEPDGRQD